MKRLFKIGLYGFGSLALVFGIMFAATSGAYSVAKTVEHDPRIPRLALNGTTFHLETFGNPENPVVIVVHGGPGWDYKTLLPLRALADEFYVVFYDQRDTGLSARVDAKTLTLDSYLNDLDAMVEHFGMGEKVSLVGHSWGAMLVSGYLGRYPGKLSHAVLAEPGFLTTEMIKEAGIAFGPKMEVDFLLHASKVWFETLHISDDDPRARGDYFIVNVAPYANLEYYCNNELPDSATDVFRGSGSSSQNVMNLIMNAEGNPEVDLVSGVERFDNKVLFLASECNRMIGEAYQKKQMKYFKHAELQIVRKSGHMMFAEQPEATIALVRTYLHE